MRAEFIIFEDFVDCIADRSNGHFLDSVVKECVVLYSRDLGSTSAFVELYVADVAVHVERSRIVLCTCVGICKELVCVRIDLRKIILEELEVLVVDPRGERLVVLEKAAVVEAGLAGSGSFVVALRDGLRRGAAVILSICRMLGGSDAL